jgi:hypothetical protein
MAEPDEPAGFGPAINARSIGRPLSGKRAISGQCVRFQANMKIF